MAPLREAPSVRVETLAELIGIANAIETEAIRRYGGLATEMRRRGEGATADAFDAMVREEEGHVAAVAGWARGLGEAVPDADTFRWRLPADLAESWEEVSGSALLTPYRAYAIAVDNEERAFAFYAYLAASATDPAIAREAEALAKEELRHAALLRTWRRTAWRQQRGATVGTTHRATGIDSVDQLKQLIGVAEAEITACHRLLGRRIRGSGDDVSADLLDRLAGEAAARTTLPLARHGGADEGTEQPVVLLLAAQRPLERLCDALESILSAAPDEPMQAAAQEALSHAVARIARLGRRIEALAPHSQRQNENPERATPSDELPTRGVGISHRSTSGRARH